MCILALRASSGVAVVLLLFLLAPPHATAAQWTTTFLSQARYYVVATSVGDLALFAGGVGLGTAVISGVVDIFNASSNKWTTATLSQARYQVAATSVGDLAFFAISPGRFLMFPFGRHTEAGKKEGTRIMNKG
jgi:uncharacterized membrane protein